MVKEKTSKVVISFNDYLPFMRRLDMPHIDVAVNSDESDDDAFFGENYYAH